MNRLRTSSKTHISLKQTESKKKNSNKTKTQKEMAPDPVNKNPPQELQKIKLNKTQK